MKDEKIVMLYWAREEAAIVQTSVKYGKMLKHISENILYSREDAEECVNDSYMSAWNSMPQNRPSYLGGYMAKLVRNLSLSRYRRANAKKRKGAGTDIMLEELEECIPDKFNTEEEYEALRLKEIIESFIESLDEEKRAVFLRRYFYAESVENIAYATNIGVSAVKTMLFRLRGQLKKHIEEAGYES